MLSRMSRLKVGTRFLLLGVLALALAAVPSTMYLLSFYRSTQAVETELSGIQPSKHLLKLMQLLQRHRGLSALVLSGLKDQDSLRLDTSKAIDAQFAQMSISLQDSLPVSNQSQIWSRSKQNWQVLQDEVATRRINGLQSFDRHTRLLEQLLHMFHTLNYESGFATDKERKSHALIDLALTVVPGLTEELGKTRATGSRMLAARQTTAVDRFELSRYLTLSDYQLSRLAQEVADAAETDHQLESLLFGPMFAATDLAKKALAMAKTQLLDRSDSDFSATEYFAVFTRAIDAQVGLNHLAMDRLEQLLSQRVAAERWELLLMLLAMLLMIGAGLGVGGAAALSIKRQLGGEPGDVMALAHAVAQGNLNSTIQVDADAEHSILSAMSDMQAALRNSQQRYQHLIESLPLGLMITQNGLIKFCNPVAAEMSGYSRGELIGHSFLPLIHTDDRPRTLEIHARRMRGDVDFVDYEIRGIRKNGAQRLWRLHVQTIDWDGVPAGLTVLTDNTDARETEIHLRELSSIVEQTDDAIMLTTVDGTIKYINPGFERLSGWRSDEVLGKKPSLFKSGAQDEHFYRQLWDTLLAGKPFNGQVINRNKSGSDYHVFKSITPMFDAEGKIVSYVNIDKDFGVQHEAQQRLEHQALHDSLTGVPNRSLLEDRIRQSIARHQREPSPFALLFIDLDDFKNVNDLLGHDAGDEVLKQIAARLMANTRPMDTVARLGGDEFVVLLQGVAELDHATQIGGKLIKAIDAPIDLQGEQRHVGASMGISLYPADASDLQTLMSRADAAMYRAKRAGGNRLDNNGDPLTQPAPL